MYTRVKEIQAHHGPGWRVKSFVSSFDVFGDIHTSLILDKTDERIKLILTYALAISAASGSNIGVIQPPIESLPVGDKMGV